MTEMMLLIHIQMEIKTIPWKWWSRSSRPEVFCKEGVFRNFSNFTGKHLCQSLFFNKVARLRLATLLKKRLWHRCFPVNFAKFLRTPFLTEQLRWQLLEGNSNVYSNCRYLQIVVNYNAKSPILSSFLIWYDGSKILCVPPASCQHFLLL